MSDPTEHSSEDPLLPEEEDVVEHDGAPEPGGSGDDREDDPGSAPAGGLPL
jgi:hypothetical protein